MEPILLKIAAKEDRTTVASILFKNGYRVEPYTGKNKGTYEYFVKCELVSKDSKVSENAN